MTSGQPESRPSLARRRQACASPSECDPIPRGNPVPANAGLVVAYLAQAQEYRITIATTKRTNREATTTASLTVVRHWRSSFCVWCVGRFILQSSHSQGPALCASPVCGLCHLGFLSSPDAAAGVLDGSAKRRGASPPNPRLQPIRLL